MSKPKIRHLAIMTLDPEKLAKFYEEVFGMTRLPKRGAPTSKAIYMSDGYITLALLENKADGKPSGLNHFGWQIDDQEAMAKRLTKAGVRAPVNRRRTAAMPNPPRHGGNNCRAGRRCTSSRSKTTSPLCCATREPPLRRRPARGRAPPSA